MNSNSKHGGKRTGSGRKAKWYGPTVAMRIPETWADRIQRCMEEGITPFENVRENVHETAAAIAELENENARLAEQLEAAHSRIEDLECASDECGEDTRPRPRLPELPEATNPLTKLRARWLARLKAPPTARP